VPFSQFGNKKTKIVATLGPSSWDEDNIRRMIQKGLNVVRINFSHGEHETHARTISMVRRVAQEEQAVVPILADIQGPKIRIGKIDDPGLRLERGDKITLTLDAGASGKDNIVSLPHPEFVRDIKAGMQLLLDDGNLEFVVTETTNNTLVCEVVIGGLLTSRKGVMAPKAFLTLSAITDKDRKDIEFALQQDVDYIAMSFVRSVEDIRELKWLIRHLKGDDATGIIAKIEKHEALQNIESIVDACDGIMVARGDLGLEVPAEEVPFHQKRIIQLCNEASKPVITATQMLSSMVESPRPTRAEASDVYNAIVDGTDAVMLSNETAMGKYPVLAVETMATIAGIAEQHVRKRELSWKLRAVQGDGREAAADAISEATYHISEALQPRAIVTTTLTGYTARRVARERPSTPILCVTPNETTYRRMALVWGVTPLLVGEYHTVDEMITKIVRAASEAGFVKRSDVLLIIAGVPFGIGGQTNLMKIHRVGESGEL